MQRLGRIVVLLSLCLCSVSWGQAAEWGLKKGAPEFRVIGPIAFGPDGILFLADPVNVRIIAVDTGDTDGNPEEVRLNIDNISQKLADVLGVGPAECEIADLAVNPTNGRVFLSVAVKSGNEVTSALVRIAADGTLSRFELKDVPFAKIDLPTELDGTRKNRYTRNSITDLAYSDGKVIVSCTVPNPKGGRGRAMVREVPFPFLTGDTGIPIEIYHGAHGRVEDYASIQTFVPFTINGEPTLLAGFTCTPLVRFDLKNLTPQKTVRGTTVAELGNRNRPYDMIVYEKDGQTWLLMANSARGVMKISTEDIGRREGITTPIRGGGQAGQAVTAIEDWKGVVQLDKLNSKHAVVVINDGNTQHLRTLPLP